MYWEELNAGIYKPEEKHINKVPGRKLKFKEYLNHLNSGITFNMRVTYTLKFDGHTD